MSDRYELRYGKWGAYFHDRERGGKDGFDMPLETVLAKLNRLEDYTLRLGEANRRRPAGMKEF